MIQIIIAYILLLSDPMIKGYYFDLLPDYFGYAFIIWGYYKISKVLKENKEALKQMKYGIISSAILFVFSYVICLLGMFGKLDNVSTVITILIYMSSDIGEIIFMYFLIKVLEKAQEDKKYFQIKGMKTMLAIIIVCDAGMYISYKKALTSGVFMVFELIVSVMFLAYIFSSYVTYKMFFIKNKKMANLNKNISEKKISKAATGFIGQKKDSNNFKNVTSTKKIKKN